MADKHTSTPTSASKVSTYKTTAPLLAALYAEIQELSKKKSEATLNASKVKLINRLLLDLQSILKDEPNIKYLDLLEDENLPQYSDVVLILSQYSAAMAAFLATHHGWNGVEHKWDIEGQRW